MFDFQQKRKLKAWAESRVVWGVLLFLTALVAYSTYDRYLIARDMAKRRAVVEQEKAKLEQRKTELEDEVKYLSNERGIEAEVRRQFDVAREGEQVVIIIKEEATTTEELATTTKETKRPWYRFW